MSVILTPEHKARQRIDQMLEDSGWQVQAPGRHDPTAALGVACCELQTKSGPVDYFLFADRRPIGVVEAKRFGTTLSGVETQAKKYSTGLPTFLERRAWYNPLPFRYESTGIETFFADDRDPDARSRPVFSFHRPETLLQWVKEPDTLRQRLRTHPPLDTERLWRAQVEAIENLELSFANDRPRALIQMATGSGKTYTAVNLIYRLIKHAGARRVLFMVDRKNLGRQAHNEFNQFTTPDDGRKLSELYNIHQMASNQLDSVAKVCITTVQRLYSILSDEVEMDAEFEDRPLGQMQHLFGDQPKQVTYNSQLPPEYFDFIVIDECHRSIYNVWRQVLEYFDAYLIGLTATPSAQTYAFFNQNLVMEYTDQQAVIDGVNVDGWVYRIRTEMTEQGGVVDAGEWVGKRDRLTRQQRWEQLDEELEYAGTQLDRDVESPDQIRLILQTYRDRLSTEIFPGRDEVPKTLVFAKSDSHAETIVRIAREVFGKGDEFCQKITYRSTRSTEELIQDLRNRYNPRIAVTVDMIATGTDVRPLEVLIFMRNIRSANFWRQMRGRGTRIVSETDLKAVSPSAQRKDHFVIVDAVGVVGSPKIDAGTVDRKRSLPFAKLVERVGLLAGTVDEFESLAVRLSRLEFYLAEDELAAVRAATGGKGPRDLARDLLAAVDPDQVLETAQQLAGDPAVEPTEEQLVDAQAQLMENAAVPFADPHLRDLLNTIRDRIEITIDEVSKDTLIEASYSESDTRRARELVDSFQDFVQQNRDRITALQLIYSRPYRAQLLTLAQIEELKQAIERPPNVWTTEALWNAYAKLERDKVRGLRAERVLTDIVSLVRHALQLDEELAPYPERVRARYQDWLEAQAAAGRTFTEGQRWWLDRIAEAIGVNLNVTLDDFQHGELRDRGGLHAAGQLFGADLAPLVVELNKALGL